eukprot:TRINITY_DN45072_c0_g1_i1.p1 TRINITY_DN45072_c0_g1~~TRINITY_DN45072_c0_g1_i1.p1  ORF type:complete len:246 (+),score=42.05 TRINITY_DN45072_c0_g1_i1:95-832(+)
MAQRSRGRGRRRQQTQRDSGGKGGGNSSVAETTSPYPPCLSDPSTLSSFPPASDSPVPNTSWDRHGCSTVGDAVEKSDKQAAPMSANVANLFATAASAQRMHSTAPLLPKPEGILGQWADSLGNKVLVLSTDAYQVRLVATLSRPPRQDIHLPVLPVVLGGGWQCGDSILDPFWSSESELHWVARSGRVSVWVRAEEAAKREDVHPESCAPHDDGQERGTSDLATPSLTPSSEVGLVGKDKVPQD